MSLSYPSFHLGFDHAEVVGAAPAETAFSDVDGASSPEGDEAYWAEPEEIAPSLAEGQYFEPHPYEDEE